MESAHILVITTNEYQESSFYQLSVGEYLQDALDDDDGPQALALLQQLAREGSTTQIDSDLMREYHIMPGFEPALEQWMADATNMAMVAEQEY